MANWLCSELLKYPLPLLLKLGKHKDGFAMDHGWRKGKWYWALEWVQPVTAGRIYELLLLQNVIFSTFINVLSFSRQILFFTLVISCTQSALADSILAALNDLWKLSILSKVWVFNWNLVID